MENLRERQRNLKVKKFKRGQKQEKGVLRIGITERGLRYIKRFEEQIFRRRKARNE